MVLNILPCVDFYCVCFNVLALAIRFKTTAVRPAFRRACPLMLSLGRESFCEGDAHRFWLSKVNRVLFDPLFPLVKYFEKSCWNKPRKTRTCTSWVPERPVEAVGLMSYCPKYSLSVQSMKARIVSKFQALRQINVHSAARKADAPVPWGNRWQHLRWVNRLMT